MRILNIFKLTIDILRLCDWLNAEDKRNIFILLRLCLRFIAQQLFEGSNLRLKNPQYEMYAR